jgi:hypothetical protein
MIVNIAARSVSDATCTNGGTSSKRSATRPTRPQGSSGRCETRATRAEAKNISDRLESVLRGLNLSALESYREAKDDLLAIHELKLSRSLKRFFSTTNPIESLNSIIEEDMRRVKRWRSSEHFQRWLATYCLNSERRMNRVHGHIGIPALWILLRTFTETKEIDGAIAVA